MAYLDHYDLACSALNRAESWTRDAGFMTNRDHRSDYLELAQAEAAIAQVHATLLLAKRPVT